MRNVLYVPLDDRPVNLADVIKQGQACGLNIITPNAADVSNRIDSAAQASGRQLNATSSPTFGNPANIRQFILNNAAVAEGLIISTDMLAYGGLIGSRRLRASAGAAYPNYDAAVTSLLDVIRQVKQLYPNKPIYVLDTVMRLATTTFTDGLPAAAYDESRALMLKPRKTLYSFDEILSGYNIAPDDTEYGTTQHFDKTQYYNTRQHKFKTNYYILDQLVRLGYIDFLAIGVDDANTQGVQINEIHFIETYINNTLDGSGGQNPNRAIILPDADGLGHSLVARMANQLHRGGTKTGISVQYYGPHGNTLTSPYEYMDAHQNILRHIDIMGGQYVTTAPTIEILAVTSPDQVSGAVGRINANGNNRVATVVMDLTGGGASTASVTEALLDSQFTGQLLGYSGWNTPGNLIGISLGMGQARYAFLVTETKKAALNAAVNAHGSLLFKRFLKDYYYKRITIANEIRPYSRTRSNMRYDNIPETMADQNMLLFNTETAYDQLLVLLRNGMQTNVNTLAAKSAFLIGNSDTAFNVKQICGSTWNFAGYSAASLVCGNPDFIWGRAFEITLDPVVSLK